MVSGIRVKTVVSRKGIDDITKFVGLPFLSPKKEYLGIIISVDVKPGPYCELTINLDESKVENFYIRELFFPSNY
jgi:hypothetical protein